MIVWFNNIWNKYGLEILVVITIFFFIFLWITKTRHKINGGKMSVYKDLYIPSKNFMKNPKKIIYNLYNEYIEQDNSGNSKDSKGEIECKKIAENIFKRPFYKTRPDFLRNVNGQNLELDVYNDELKIAIEYNGRQHYHFIPYFHKTRDGFNNQKQRDFIKRLLCEKNKINLIEVPYNVKIEDIKYFIMNELDKIKLKN
jgi:hypothetical protein